MSLKTIKWAMATVAAKTTLKKSKLLLFILFKKSNITTGNFSNA